MSRLRRYWRDWLSGGGYLMLLMLGLHLGSAPAWDGILAATLALGLLAWHWSLRRQRAVTDTPTSRIASAAQGYVELVGIGQAPPDLPVYSPTHHLPCLWYRYRAYVRDNDKWRQTESDESISPFLLDDGSGRCLVDPTGADIVASRRETYISGDHKVEEEILLAGDRLYALGDFASAGGGHVRFDERAELGRILAEWKEDQADLLERFDLDGDGRIDDREWQLARQAARREMAAQRHEALNQPVSHFLNPPRHGRPHLIASVPPETLAKHYRLRTRLHGSAAFASLIGLAVALQATLA